MKKKIYSVIWWDGENMGLFGSKTKLCETLFEDFVLENVEKRIDNNGNRCLNCTQNFNEKLVYTSNTLGEFISVYLYCSHCDLIYCNKCVNTCIKCNKMLLSQEEMYINLKNKLKKQIKKDVTSLQEFLGDTVYVEEKIIELSDDESDESDIE